MYIILDQWKKSVSGIHLHLLAVCFWSNNLMFLSFSVLICKVRIKIILPIGL